MTLPELQILLAKWIREDVDDKLRIREIKSRIDFLSVRLFQQYRAGSGAAPNPFRHKLAAWLASESEDENQKLMFRMLNYVTFFGNDELLSLYRTVYSRNILDWIISTSNIDLLDPNAREQIARQLADTCFVALTDSFSIGEFIRINGISGVSSRITFSSISPHPTAAEFKQNYIKGRSRLVLFDDFVGSASQIINVVKFATELGDTQPLTLFCPLIICPDGDRNSKLLASTTVCLSYNPVLALPASDFITTPLDSNAPGLFENFKQLAETVHPKVRATGWLQDYGPLGYRQTGALVVKADNCPDNTLPMIHHTSTTPWSALFVRVPRE